MTKNQEIYLEQQKLYLSQLENSSAYYDESISNLGKTILLDTQNLEIYRKRSELNKIQIENTKVLIDDLESNEEYECIKDLELADNTKFEKGRTFFRSSIHGINKLLIEQHFIRK